MDESQPPPKRGRRRAKRKDQWRMPWVPEFLIPGFLKRFFKPQRKVPILPNLPRHSESAIFSYRTGTKRKRKLVRRGMTAFIMRWRYLITLSIVTAVIVAIVGGALIWKRDEFNDTDRLPTQAAPTLEELNNSIALGEQYINALYKPLPNGAAVQSEASGVPLKAHFLGEDVWVLLGEDKTECSTGEDDCQVTTSLTDVHDDSTHDYYTVSFSTPKKRAALNVKVEINWAFSASQFHLQITPDSVKEKVELWLDNTKLVEFNPDSKEKAERAFNDSDQSQLRMLRFTVRHATQEAYLYWSTYGRDPVRAAALQKFLVEAGYKPGFDLRASLFDQGDKDDLLKDLPDDLPTADESYPDCQITAAETKEAYAYRSKVCLFESQYIVNGERDPFLQAWAALTILMKYGDPNHEQPQNGFWTQGDTPNEVSAHLRGQWNRSGYGMPKCTPFSCGELSGIRTSVFGALETQLGYAHDGDRRSRLFADAAAKVITQAQIQPDGKIVADNGNTYVRPGQVGSYLSAWVPPSLDFTQPSVPKLPVALALWWKGSIPTPIEYQGIIPSNSETTLDALGFLQMYRCAKYKVC
jgi:hypothetical protein